MRKNLTHQAIRRNVLIAKPLSKKETASTFAARRIAEAEERCALRHLRCVTLTALYRNMLKRMAPKTPKQRTFMDKVKKKHKASLVSLSIAKRTVGAATLFKAMLNGSTQRRRIFKPPFKLIPVKPTERGNP